jgi:ribosomal protein S18 acetylase RimI-like enzyme
VAIMNIVELTAFNTPVTCDLLIEAFGSPPAALCARSRFETGSWTARGYVLDGEIVAFIGLEPLSASKARIRGIAVHPAHRRMGIGRRLIESIMAANPALTLYAETDGDAVGFYRACGFGTTSLGNRLSGTERFACVADPTRKSA